jgi:predicted ribosomally synthesized peptide with nif11-like leader
VDDKPITGDRVDRRTGMGIERLLKDLKGDKLADKFKGCESIDEFVATARELGYDIDADEAERASDLSDELLEGIAGGGGFIDPTIVEYTTC